MECGASILPSTIDDKWLVKGENTIGASPHPDRFVA
jgi:hypothetical protein